MYFPIFNIFIFKTTYPKDFRILETKPRSWTFRLDTYSSAVLQLEYAELIAINIIEHIHRSKFIETSVVERFDCKSERHNFVEKAGRI